MNPRRMKSAVVVSLCLLLVPPVAVLADGDERDAWLAAYPDACETLRNAANSCVLCHDPVPSLNSYGSDWDEFSRGGSENIDSDGDSRTNLQEIRECTLPYDANSTPVVTSTWGAIKALFE